MAEIDAHDSLSREAEVSDATTGRTPMTTVELGARYVRRGLWLFVFGVFVGFGPWGHYMHGAMEDVHEAFLKNVTPWFACPWTLAAYVVQLGSVAMVVFGLCYLVSARDERAPVSAGEAMALTLCMYGILAEFLAGFPFYFVVNHMWPDFYFTPIEAGKHLWLSVQGICIAGCFAGAVLAVRGITRRLNGITQN